MSVISLRCRSGGRRKHLVTSTHFLIYMPILISGLMTVFWGHVYQWDDLGSWVLAVTTW